MRFKTSLADTMLNENNKTFTHKNLQFSPKCGPEHDDWPGYRVKGFEGRTGVFVVHFKRNQVCQAFLFPHSNVSYNNYIAKFIFK